MRILQINASYKPAYIYGGPTMSVAKISEQLTKHGHHVAVFTTTANGPDELLVDRNKIQNIDGVYVTYFKRLTKDHTHFSPRLLIRLWKEVKTFDIVHIHAWWNFVSILSCFIAVLRKVPVVLSPRGTLSRYSFTNNHLFVKKILHNLIGKALLNRCYLHATSVHEQEALKKILKPRSIFTIYNAIKFPESLPRHIPQGTPLKLLFFSRIDPKKGLELLFAALSGISFPYRLTIAGTGDEQYIASLKKLSRKYQIENHLDWIGFRGNDKFETMAGHHLMVLPSYDENFGNVVIESLSVGTAVLISKEVGLASYVEENNLGWICETNVHSLKETLVKVSQNTGLLDIIKEFAPIIIVREFNENRIIQKYLEMYQRITID